MIRRTGERISEGKFAADVPVDLIEDEHGWSPGFSPEDVAKLDRVRLALRRGDVAAAAKEAKVYELTLLAGE